MFQKMLQGGSEITDIDVDKMETVYTRYRKKTNGSVETGTYTTTSQYDTKYIVVLIGASTDPNSNQSISLSNGKIVKTLNNVVDKYSSLGVYIVDVPVGTTITGSMRYLGNVMTVIGFKV